MEVNKMAVRPSSLEGSRECGTANVRQMPGTRQEDRTLPESHEPDKRSVSIEWVGKLIEEMQALKAALHPGQQK
jgi:hypothetical protein